MQLTQAPAVHTRRRSRWNPSAVDQAITMAAHTTRYVPQAMAVFHEGETIGLIKGSFRGDVSEFTPITHKQWMGFDGYGDLNTKAKNGKITRIYWYKTASTWTFAASWGDIWPCGGDPAAGAYSGTALTARQFNNTTAGGIHHDYLTPAASETKHLVEWYCELVGNTASTIRSIILYDRVLSYEAATISSTTVTLTNTLAAQRYIAGGQDGLLMSVVCQTLLGATASTLTGLTYTDQLGNTGVSQAGGGTQDWDTGAQAPTTTLPASIIMPVNIAQNLTCTPFVCMSAGVTGIRKMETYISSATNTGTVAWALVKPIGTLWGLNSVVQSANLARAMFALERVYDDACLSFMFGNVGATGCDIGGKLTLVHG